MPPAQCKGDGHMLMQPSSRPPGRFDTRPAVSGDAPADPPPAGTPDVPPPALPDREAFAALLAQHSDAMMRVAAMLLGIGEAEDAAQEALVRAWRAWSTLRSPDTARAWLLRITVNVCREWRRGKRGRILRLTQPLPDETSDVTGLDVLGLLNDDPGSSDHTGAMDLRQAVRLLPLDYRIVIALRYYAGLEPHEIAAALSIPAPTVRTRQYRALAMLRRNLEDAGVRIPTPRSRQEEQ